MIAQTFDPLAELQSAFNLLTKNFSLASIPIVAWIINVCLIGAAVGLAGAPAAVLFGANAWSIPALISVVMGALLWFSVAAVLMGIVWLVAHGAVIAASESLWEGRPADIGAGVSRALSRLVDLFFAGLIIAVIVLALLWTVVGPLAVIFLMMYVGPAIVVGGEGAIEAIGTSWRMSTQNAGQTLAAFVGIVLAGIVVAIIHAVLTHLWVIGWIVEALVSGAFGAYVALVVVRFYDLFRNAPRASAAPPPPPPATM